MRKLLAMLVLVLGVAGAMRCGGSVHTPLEQVQEDPTRPTGG
ncbi:hypothetical protein [Deinococcus aestuarii]|nr:hypothetical protein [Deinococcus aestuarii]